MARKSLFFLFTLIVVMMFSKTSNGEVYDLGWGLWGGWPPHSWIETQDIHIGDRIGFVFIPFYDNVLQVTRENYEACNRTNPIAIWEGESGYGAFDVTEYGNFYFISGFPKHCEALQRVQVHVKEPQSPGTLQRPSVNAPSPSEGPSMPTAPTPSPSSSSTGLSSLYFILKRFGH